MQMGEGVVVDLVMLDDIHGNSCPFCEESELEDKTNDLKNNSKKLGKSMIANGDKNPRWRINCKHPNRDEMLENQKLRTNAHHLIPGNQSLKNHPIVDYIEAGSNKVIESDIGYDVNDCANGIWLPSYPDIYAGGKTAEVAWSKMTAKLSYTQFGIAASAMKQAKRQFHDGHVQYSNKVKECLDTIRTKIVLTSKGCPEKGKSKKPYNPPYGLVSRLNRLSSNLREKLEPYSPRDWVDPIFTSRHSKRLSEWMLGKKDAVVTERMKEIGK